MYEVGDLIVYGRTGICEVTEITTLKMDGVPKDKLYYILRPVREKRGKVFTPVDNEKIVMRRVISKEEAEELSVRFHRSKDSGSEARSRERKSTRNA